MACDDNYEGLPVPSSNIQWTGPELKNLMISELGCRPKLNKVIELLDNALYEHISSFDMTKVTGSPFVSNIENMKFYDFVNALSVWAIGIENQFTSPDSNLNIGTMPVNLNMSCLVSSTCATTTYSLNTVLESMINKICMHEADIKRLKEALLSNFDTQLIYIPQT
jgi:hypothetical protein